MSKKLLKKIKEKEEKLLDAVYELQELLDSTEDGELSSMGDTFCEAIVDFLYHNDTITLTDIQVFIEEDLNS